MIKAIDVHAHISTEPWLRSTRKFADAMKVYYKTEQRVRSEEEMAQDFIRAGVKGCIIAWDAEAGTGEPRTPNDYIADLVRKYPEAYAGGWAMVDPWKGQMALQEIERAVKELTLLGVKFQQGAQAFFPDDHRFYPIWDLCQSLGVPVQFHTGTTGMGAGVPGGLGIKLKYMRPIPHIDDVATDSPRLTTIMCHAGWPWHDFREFEAEGYKPEVLEKIYLRNPQRILGLTG